MAIKYVDNTVLSSFNGEDLLDFRLEAFTKTGTITNLHDFVTALEWTESLDSAAISGTVTIFDPDKEIDIRKGNRLRLSMRSPYGKKGAPYKEINRFVVWSRTRTSKNSPYLKLQFYDIMIYLMESTDSFLFQKDGGHPKGWTPTQITKWIAKKYKIPLGRIPVSKHRIPYLNLEESSLYDAILMAWSLDRKVTRKQYVIRAINDKLWVFPKQRKDTMWSISEGSNLIDSSYTDSLEGMATAVTVLAVSEEATAAPGAGLKATVVNKGKVAEFGYIHKLEKVQGVTSRAQALKVARNSLLVNLRDNKDATITSIGIPELRAGDPVAVADISSGIVGRFWCSETRHTLSAGQIQTSINLNWLDIVPSKLPSEQQTNPNAATSGVGGGSFYTVPGTSSSKVEAVIAAARSMLGVPYAWGGGTARGTSYGVGHGDQGTKGIDCSGLTLFSYAQVGINLPHHTDAQARLGVGVPLGQEAPGDLVFFKGGNQAGTVYGHMGMYTGNGKVIEAVRPYVKEGPRSGWDLVRRFPQLNSGGGTASTVNFSSTTGYPGDNAGQQAIARWMGGQAAAAGLPPELPVMAALVESGVRNLQYGDRDSVGFFQMRLSIWSATYPGYQSKPDLQMKWFITQAKAIQRKGGYRNGDYTRYGSWCADIERPAAQYRYRYQTKYFTARALLGLPAKPNV